LILKHSLTFYSEIKENAFQRDIIQVFLEIAMEAKKSEELVKGQQKFFTNIQKDGFVIKRGRIMPLGNVYKEKGTDVKIAVDLIVGAVDNIYDTAILVSSDTDLIPAIRYIKYKKKKLEYVGFAHAPSLGIQKYADFSILLLPRDIERFKEKTLL